LDAVHAIPILREIGKQYSDNVQLTHLVGDVTASSVSDTR